jgi:hypothetical protein
VIIVFLTAFAISTIMQCFLYSTFFNRANLAACVAGFLYFIMYLPYTLAVQWEDFMTLGHKVLSVSMVPRRCKEIRIFYAAYRKIGGIEFLASLSICWFVCVCLQNFNVGHIS